MAIGDDFSIATNGDIRYTGSGTNYTVLAFHQWINGLLDDAQAAGDDLADITTNTISERSTNQIVELNSPYNIDDTAARHLYNGSVKQLGGDTLYAGLEVLGPVETGTEPVIVQDDKVLPPYWSTGINADAANNIVMRLMIKVRDGGADIDGKRLLVRAREYGDGFTEFAVTMKEGVSVAAIANGPDLNNGTAAATVRGWTTIAVAEGQQLIDINNDGTDEEYYEQWDKGSQTVNNVFEWSKLQAARSLTTLNGTDTGTNYVVDNATIVGQAQSFTSRAVAEKLTEARFRLKIAAGAPTGPLTAELYASTAGVIPTGSALATSDPVLASLITSTYQEVIFRFNDNVTLAASTQYCIVIRHPTGDASNNFHVEGAASGTVSGENKAEENPVTTWTAQAAADLWFTVKSTPVLHARPGEMHRGITHEIVYDTEVGGPFTENEIVFWGTDITYDTLSGTFTVGEYVKIERAATVINGGKILRDNGTTQMMVALEDITVALADGDTITGLSSGASCDINVTIVDDDKDGGEGVLLALDDNGADGDLYIQLISGKAPVNNLPIEGRSSGATCLVNVTVTGRTLSQPFIGSSTGTNIIGAYGIGFQTTDVAANDLLTALDNVARNPPNNVTFSVTGLVAGEDRVLVGPRTGTALDKGQFTTDTTLSAAAETALSLATVAVPTDTPSTGQGVDNSRLRVQRDSGVYSRQPYASYDAATPGNFTLSLPDSGAGGIQIDVVATAGTFTRSTGSFLTDGFEKDARFTGSGFANGGNNATFTVSSVSADGLTITVVDNTGMVDETGSGDERLLASGWDYSTDNSTTGNNVFIAYIDVLADAGTESYTAVYNADRDILVRVRDGGGTPIKTFEAVAAQFLSTNQSSAAIRNTDA